MRPELKALADGLIEIVRGYVFHVESALGGRIGALEKRLDELPAPRDGVPGKEGPPGRDAAPVDEAAIVLKVLAALPAPAAGRDGKDGTSVTADDVRPLVAAEVTRAVAALPPALPGRDGRDGLNGLRGEKGADGRDGTNGKDGLGFDDMEVQHDGERQITLKFQRGERLEEFPLRLPVVIDRGVFKEGTAYERGDAATWAGSLWIAQAATSSKPDAGDGTWRLSVKRGRDGKDGAPGERGEKGERGQSGLNAGRYE